MHQCVLTRLLEKNHIHVEMIIHSSLKFLYKNTCIPILVYMYLNDRVEKGQNEDERGEGLMRTF